MVRRHAKDAGVETAIGNHSFRAIGITDYLERGGDINIEKRSSRARERVADRSQTQSRNLTAGRGHRFIINLKPPPREHQRRPTPLDCGRTKSGRAAALDRRLWCRVLGYHVAVVAGDGEHYLAGLTVDDALRRGCAVMTRRSEDVIAADRTK
jgi:hypothetical protein